MLCLQRLSQLNIKFIVFKTLSSSTNAAQAIADKANSLKSDIDINSKTKYKTKNPIVAAAFASLSEDKIADPFLLEVKDKNDQQDLSIDDRIINAKTVTGLLTISELNSPLSRRHALKIVSILSEWTTINKAKLSDFENDTRFLKLCRVLGRTVPKNDVNERNGNAAKKVSGFRTDDLNTVLGVTGDDEAAKLISSLTLNQMVKVMGTLASKKRRSTPLLRSLAYNITSNPTTLDLKQCSDLLYSMALLNFPDSILIGRICTDLTNGLNTNIDKPAVVGSIITSLGMLKYRDLDALESLTRWVLQHQTVCRPHDISALLLTLATLNYQTTQYKEIKDNLVDSVTELDLQKSTDWVDNVWALVLLDIAKPHQIESVLKIEFIEKLKAETSGNSSPKLKMKLLQISAAYKGEGLADDKLYEIPLVYNRTKQTLVVGMLDALKSLVSTQTLIQTHINTNMGFVIDALCYFDNKGNPIGGDKLSDGSIKVAILVLDYHDLCQGNNQSILNGVSALAVKLLEKNNYKVVTVPHTEFNTSDKLLKRVQYLESKLKKVLNQK